ncbi:MAG: TlpA family protein disulfide reductase [Candidatus Marinimicrobia bacterium]|nr:TlpA family protein disulfide reductase [Candidatus Neomarinimicrobiota bacterium]MBL7067865.1 TlpA family protein disulfide reductase [Candidatus Neomarinimicrobiota bacterium]
MRKFSAIILSLITIVLADSTLTSQPGLTIGEDAPGCYAPFLESGDFFLGRYVGPKAHANLKSPVVFSFFTTSCIPCRKEIPYIHTLKEEYPGVSMFLVNVGENKQKVSAFIKAKGYTLPVLLDRYGKISEKYNAQVTPTLIIINENGKIDFYKQGYKETDNEMIRQSLERLYHPKKP